MIRLGRNTKSLSPKGGVVLRLPNLDERDYSFEVEGHLALYKADLQASLIKIFSLIKRIEIKKIFILSLFFIYTYYPLIVPKL